MASEPRGPNDDIFESAFAPKLRLNGSPIPKRQITDDEERSAWIDEAPLPEPPPPPTDSDGFTRDADGRVTIELDPQVPEIVQAERATRALAEDGRTWVRDCALYRVVGATEEEQEESRWTDSRGRTRFAVRAGQPMMRPLSKVQLRGKLGTCCTWKRYIVKGKTADLQVTKPDVGIIEQVHELQSWPGIKRLVGIARTPFLRPDGTICQTPGYDAKTGYFLALSPDLVGLEVAECPTQDEARAALSRLRSVFADFPYSDESGYMVPIAAALTLVARAAIDGSTPGFAFDSAKGGEGKTLQTDAVAMLATGEFAARSAYSSEEEEVRKALDAFAMIGADIVCLDDCKHAIGGSTIDTYLTARDTIAVRVLGENKHGPHKVPWRGVFMCTGVKLRTKGQTGRRLLFAKVVTGEVSPQLRTGFHIEGDLLDHCRDHRRGFVSDMLTVLRSYCAHGRPGAEECVWGSFQQWAELVAGALRYAGGADVLAARRETEAETNPEVAALCQVLTLLMCHQSRWGGTVSSRQLLEELFERSPGDDLAELKDAIEALLPPHVKSKPSARSITAAFQRYEDDCQYVDGDVCGLSSMSTHDKSVRWYVKVRA